MNLLLQFSFTYPTSNDRLVRMVFVYSVQKSSGRVYRVDYEKFFHCVNNETIYRKRTTIAKKEPILKNFKVLQDEGW